ncbi:MAG: ABC transporter ATP-binding protein/permease [Rhizobiaceae bacterium]|nr:ABC transporter ATP-binding protein/permease [Rhizobiaceae bacterium]
MQATLKTIWRLAKIAASGPGSGVTLFLLAIIIALELASIWISLEFIAWNARFFDALEDYEVSEALHQTAFYFGLTGISALRFLVSDYLRKYVLIRWRTRLTIHTTRKWLENRSYFYLRKGMAPTGLENPDQRISEDCRLFVSGLLNESLDLFTRIVGIFSYVAVLWGLTNFALNFTLFGIDFSLPHYLVWLAFIYVLVSSILTHLLGWPLKNLLFEQEHREAEFRYALVQLRDNASEIASAGGEQAEKERLGGRFGNIIHNWQALIRREFLVGMFTRPYFQTVLRIPLFLSLPAYLTKEVTLGGLMQLASAFSNVTTTLSWFIFSYRDLADFVATSERLDGLLQMVEHRQLMPGVPVSIEHSQASEKIEVSNFTLFSPAAIPLATIPDICIEPGEKIWIHAPSGSGKTTLLRAIAGIWPYGDGRISRPGEKLLFASHTPYLTPDGIKAALSYPENSLCFQPCEYKTTLEMVGLAKRVGFLEADGPHALEGLSNGEKQRLVFARILLLKPAIILLDEATSALNREAEEAMFGLVRKHLPASTIICVSHHRPSGMNIDREMDLSVFIASQSRNKAGQL